MLSSSAVLWLSGEQWTAIAAASQGLAAVGAIALLVVTRLSQRDARNAIENARLLASHTESLVRAIKAEAELGVMPVIELTFEKRESRFRLSNRGNGPLLAPIVRLNGSELSLLHEDTETSAFIRSAAIASGTHVFALTSASSVGSGTMIIDGFTLSGSRFHAEVDASNVDSRAAALARTETES